MSQKFRFGVNGSSLALAAAFLTAAPSAFAQNASSATSTAAQGVDDEGAGNSATTDDGVNEIVVIGVGSNIAGVGPVGSEAITFDREQILQSGKTSVADVVRTLPQVRNLGEFREGGTQGGANSQQGNAINLRGLGVGATLVLVNGRRVVATGAAATFTEANQVPLAAIESIEVITDGASAIYGSDAVAGVINYVLRKDYEGIETSFRMSNTTGGWEYTPSITAGTRWALGERPGNIIVSYEYSYRDAYLRGDNKWLRQDLRAVGGPDLRISGATGAAGRPGNIFVDMPGAGQNAAIPLAGTHVYYGLPDSASGTGISFSQLALNQPNLIDTADYTDYTGKNKKHHASAYLNQEVTDWLSVYLQGGYSRRHTFSRQIASFMGAIQNVTVPQYLYDPATNLPDLTKANPAYITGIPGVAPGADLNVQYNFFDSSGFQNWDNTVEDYTVTAGADLKLPGSWRGQAYYTYGFNDACNFCALGSNINPEALQYLINIGEINPLSTTPFSPATLARMTGDNVQQSGNRFDDWVVKFDGPLFAIPGGMVRAAVGGEVAKIANWNENGRNKGIDNIYVIDTDKSTSIGKRTIKSLFGELFVPVISSDMDVPLMQRLVLSGAVRYDDYSDVGNTTNPKIGFTWDVADAVSLRGSWGTSFRAPGLPDVNPSAISGAMVFGVFPNQAPGLVHSDFCFPNGQGGSACFTTGALLFGANPEIGPEEATTWSLGADFKPVKNLRISTSYYNVNYEGRIISPNAMGGWFQGAPDFGGYGQFIIPINNTNVTGPNSCSFDPKLQDIMSRPILYGTTLVDPCLIDVIFDGRSTNFSATKQTGIDAQIDYSLPITDGMINLNLSVNKIISNKMRVTPTDGFTDVKGQQDQPVEWSARGAIGAVYKQFNATLFVNYVGSYWNTQAVNPVDNSVLGDWVKVKDWTTFDLSLGYGGKTDGFLKGYRASATVQNLFDKEPPTMITSNGAFNASYANPFGRRLTLQITTNF